MNLKKLMAIALIALLSLSACATLEEEPVDTTKAYQMDFVEHTFTLAGMPSFVHEENVYRVSSEEEVALLSYLKLEEHELSINYVSDQDLDFYRISIFLQALVPFSFVLSGTQKSYTQNEKVVLNVQGIRIEPSFEDYNLIDDYAHQIVNELNFKSSSTLQEIENIHDYIVLNTEYDESVLDLDLTKVHDHLSFDALGVFTQGLAVCSGYARAFKALSTDLNIPSLVVSSEAMNHAWNLVYDGDEWKFIDTTFNDPIPDEKGRVLYTYFMLDEEDFIKDGKHVFNTSSQTRLSADDYIAFANYVYFNE